MRNSRKWTGGGWGVWLVWSLLLFSPATTGCGHGISLLIPRKSYEGLKRTFIVRAPPKRIMAGLQFHMLLVYSRDADRYVNYRGRRVARYQQVKRGPYTLDLVDRFSKTRWFHAWSEALYGTRYKKHTYTRNRERITTIRGGRKNKIRGWRTEKWKETKTYTTAHRERTGTRHRKAWLCHRGRGSSPVRVRPGRAVERVTVRWDPRRRASVVSFRAIGPKYCSFGFKRKLLVRKVSPRVNPGPPPRTGLNRMLFVTSGGVGYRYTHSDWKTDGSWNIPTTQRHHSTVVDYADLYWGSDRFDFHLRVGDLVINHRAKKIALERDIKVEYLQRIAATVALFGRRGLFARSRSFYLGLGAAAGFMHWNAPGEVPGVGDPPRADLKLFGFEVGPSLTLRFPLARRWPVTMLLMSSYLVSVYGRARLALATEQFDKEQMGDHHMYGQALLSVKVATRTFVDAGLFFSYRIAAFEGIQMRGFTITPLARLSWGF